MTAGARGLWELGGGTAWSGGLGIVDLYILFVLMIDAWVFGMIRECSMLERNLLGQYS